MIELTNDDLGILSGFEKITRVMPSDYLSTENFMLFLVSPEQLPKALGNRGANMEKLRTLFRKKVVIIKDSDDPETFVRNFFANITVYDFEERNVMGENNILLTIDEKDRGLAIGRDGERIKAAKVFLKKKFKATIQLRTKRGPKSSSGGVQTDDPTALTPDAAPVIEIPPETNEQTLEIAAEKTSNQ